MAWGLLKLRHFKEKWTRCWRKAPWNGGLSRSRILVISPKAAGGWCIVIDLSSPNRFVTHQVQDGDSVIGPGVEQEGGFHVLGQPQGYVLPASDLPELATFSAERSCKQGLSVLHEVVWSGLGVSLLERYPSPSVTG